MPALKSVLPSLAVLGLAACQSATQAPTTTPAQPSLVVAEASPTWLFADVEVSPEEWPVINVPALDPGIEARIDEILPKLTLEQKVGQVIQADSEFVTPEQVKKYRLGSVLSGGNSAPGDLPYAAAEDWVAAADAYFEASLDPEGVEIAIPLIWGIDAVHGHTNLLGATIFPHNVGLGATNDPDLIREIAAATAAELIVSGHDWTFAPTLAVPRDDRWGRAYEGFSEDPEIVASYAAGIVEGLQGVAGTEAWLGYGHVLSSAKHFAADGGTENGRDQGDARISEKDFRDIHAAGYFPALEAGVQTVMASFSSWNGIKIHGSKALLTDILKTRMGFTGFVVGDWNAHGQIPGCTNTDCPQALMAGLDMYMAPDSWEALYISTLQHVKDGTIPMERLDDAVRRILRVKLAYGLFDKAKPSERPGAGDVSLLASEAHKEVARRAVRQSLVLLKNNASTLPLEAAQTVLVVGDGADSISKASGGWTLSWQGGGADNALFPQGKSILAGIREAVEGAGGTVIHDPAGTSGAQADVVIAVYGEDPYAEFQGDRDNLDFVPDGFDTGLLDGYRKRGAKVVSVFLSGRPMWVNPEINASDAFVAAWWPGSEGAGIADLLFRQDASHDFTGRLSFSWPATAVQTRLNRGDADYAPLFPYGYGLSYDAATDDMAVLPEDSGLSAGAAAERGAIFVRGQVASPWGIRFNGLDGPPGRVDHGAQEDALALSASSAPAAVSFETSGEAVDWSRESNGAMELSFFGRSLTEETATLSISMGCALEGNCSRQISVTVAGEWTEYRVSLGCFAEAGTDMSKLIAAARFGLDAGRAGIARIVLAEDKDGRPDCGE